MNQLADFFSKLFQTSDWPPRWHCGKWTEFHGWLYIISDLLIWSAYFTIPIVIIKYITKKKETRFAKLYFLFAAFILACGATHFLDAVAFWIPLYRLSALFRLITGVISWVTVFYLVKYLPVVFSLKPQRLFEIEIEQRKASEEKFRGLLEAAPDAMVIANEKGEIVLINQQTEKLFGYIKEELIGKPVEILIPVSLQHNHIKHREKFTKDPHVRGMGAGMELEAVKKDGTKCPVEISLSPLVNEGGILISASIRDITARKKANDHMRFLATITDNIQDPVISTDNNGNITRWNYAAELLLEWKSEEVIGKNAATLLKADYLKMNSNQIFKALAEKNFWQAEIIYFTKLNKQVNVLITASQLKDAKGNITGNLALVRDITERKIAEEKLTKLNAELEQRVIERTAVIEKNEKRFRVLLENNHDIISLIDDTMKLIYRSPSSTRLTGWTDEDMKSSNGIINIHPDDQEKIKNIIAVALDNPGKPKYYLFRYLHKKGYYIWLEGTATKLLPDDDINGIVFNSRDVTERIELELLLNKANTLARIGSWEVDMIKETVYWSDITKEIHETAEDYIPDLTTSISFYKEGVGRNLITKKVKEAIELGSAWDLELQIVTAKNNERWIRTIGEAEFLNGKCIRIYGSFQDVDQRKKTEEKISVLNAELEEKVIKRTEELKKSNEELEAFSYSVSHDLRTPLRAVNGYARMLEEDYYNVFDDEGKRLLVEVQQNAKKMGILIDELLAFSRLGRKEVEKSLIDMNKLVEMAVKELTQSTNHHATIKIWKLLPVKADQALLLHVMVNLLSNAIKYSSKKEKPFIEIKSYRHKTEVVYSIKDNGAGFDMDFEHKLFGVFQRLHSTDEFDGTGVGLAIAHRIIHKHMGNIWAEGKTGEGATFYFSLPDKK